MLAFVRAYARGESEGRPSCGEASCRYPTVVTGHPQPSPEPAARVDVLFLITGFLTADFALGGAEAQVNELALRLSARGWKVAIVSLVGPAVVTERLRLAHIEVEHLGMARGIPDPRALIRLRRLLRRMRPRVVHSHMIHANLLARLSRVIAPMPSLVCTSHSIGEEGIVKETLLRLTDRLAEKTTHVSRIGMEYYRQKRIVADQRALWVPNGIDLRRFGGRTNMGTVSRRPLDVSGGRFVWLAVGVFRSMKAFDRLLRAFAQLPGGAHLLLVGDGPEKPVISRTVKDLDLHRRVTLLGARGDVDELMKIADAFVLSSSHGEALPLVLLEASASGLPIVTTDSGGCAEIVRDSVSGIVVAASDPAALAPAMERLMAMSRDSREAMGKAGRAWVTKYYDMDHVVGRWEELYRELLR